MGQGDERGREAVRSGARGGLRAPLPFALAALFAAMPQGAWAQTASQVTPPTYAPPPVRPTDTIVLPEGPGVPAPAGAENLDVTLGGIVVEGDDDPHAAAAILRTHLSGHPLKTAEIFAQAHCTQARSARDGQTPPPALVPSRSRGP